MDFLSQMKLAAGSARYWLDQVENNGFRPHVDGVDNTAVFVAHYEKQYAEATNYLSAHA